MQDIIEAILDLQPEWTAANTEPMQLRGLYVRQDARNWIQGLIPTLVPLMPRSAQDLAARGRDATGPKSELPWVRLYSASHSPTATQGFYLVYLFDAEGKAAYLSLNQGTTTWDGSDFISIPEPILRNRVAWARLLIDSQIGADLVVPIDLLARRTALGRQYEIGSIAAIGYPRDSVPPPSILASDLARMASLLAVVYAGEDVAPVPGDPPGEVIAMEDAIASIAGRPAKRRGGFRPNAAERKAIEERAMVVARNHFERDGWISKDSHATRPFDFEMTRDGVTLYLEVKGTCSDGSEIILTRGEVDWMRSQYPNTSLAVVSQIALDIGGQTPMASGGLINVVIPWAITDERLVALSYSYSTNEHSYP